MIPGVGKRLLFWDEQAGELQPLLDFLGVNLRDRRYGQPKDHIRKDIPRSDREELARALERTDDNLLMGYLGWADCRMCQERLGTCDLFGHGFVWPERAEHYILHHDVWTPECGEMLAVLRKTKQT